jgi:hypothetical protein
VLACRTITRADGPSNERSDEGRSSRITSQPAAPAGTSAASGEPDKRLYLDDQLCDIQTLSVGRMVTHLRYAVTVRGKELDTIEVEDDHLPIGRCGTMSQRMVLSASSVDEASRRYRLVPLPGEPGEGAPLRAFRAFPLHE